MKESLIFLDFLHQWHLQISGGRSTLVFLESYTKELPARERVHWQRVVLQILKDPYCLPNIQKLNRYEKLAVRLLRCSLLGGSIQVELESLSVEFEEYSVLRAELKMQKIPIYLSMIMLFLLFPAYLCLLMGPVINNLIISF